MAGLSSQTLVNWAVSSTSNVFIPNRTWSYITPNSEILVFMICGIIGTLLEVAGYWPVMKVTELFGGEEPRTELQSALYKISEGVDIARFYSVHIYLAAYILLPYPLLTENEKLLLVPWLLCGVLRSGFLALLSNLAGILLCASQQSIHYPCLQFCVVHAVEFCFSVFVWTCVHNFYYFLDSRQDVEIKKVLETIHKAGLKRKVSGESMGSPSMLSIDSLGEVDGCETTLIERAAMAWIAREILESGVEYETDRQFSEYLALKATMELRQIMKELSERHQEKPKMSNKKGNMEERVRDSLEFCLCVSNLKDSEQEKPKDTRCRDSLCTLQAFEQSVTLSRRDPLRRIPPLTSRRKPFLSVQFEDNEERSVDVQTDPPGPGLALLLDTLEKQHVEVQDKNNEVPDVQTDPPGPGLALLLDTLEKQHAEVQDKNNEVPDVQTDPPGPGLALLLDTLEKQHAEVQDKNNEVPDVQTDPPGPGLDTLEKQHAEVQDKNNEVPGPKVPTP